MHVKKFRQYLLGRSFVIRTDHAALQWLRRTPEPIGQQARWLEILEEFDFQIQHRPGMQHCYADSLSRSVSTVTADRTDWATLQRSDPVIGPIYRLVQAGEPRPTPESVAASDSEMKSLCAQCDQLVMINGEILCRNFVSNKPGETHQQVVVPSALRREIVDELHRGLNGGHLGYRRAKATVRRRFYWPGWASDVRLAKQRCHQCAKFQHPRPHRQ